MGNRWWLPEGEHLRIISSSFSHVDLLTISFSLRYNLSSRSRGISRHVPVELVRWLDFARHDRMIAADRFSDSLWGYKSVYKKGGKIWENATSLRKRCTAMQS